MPSVGNRQLWPETGVGLGALLYVFLDTSDLARKRRQLEDALGFVAVEQDPHAPHEHHGVVKYDAGPLLVGLNLGGRRRVPPWRHALTFHTEARDAAAVLSAAAGLGCVGDPAGGRLADVDGHVFTVTSAAGAPARAVVRELRLAVGSVARAVAFYTDRLGLPVVERGPGEVVVSAGNLRLRLAEPADPHDVDRRGFLPVFHTEDMAAARAWLGRRGVAFRSEVQDSEIGLTCRLADPDHNPLCLYQPAARTFEWGAGAKMAEIIGTRR